MRIIIVGAGEVGFHIARKLASEDKEVVVVDKDASVLGKVSESIDVQTIAGSGSSPAILEEAGIGEADILLAVTDSDEINLIACTFASILAPGIKKLARIRNEEYTRYWKDFSGERLGIEMIINPEVEVIKTVERLLGAPDTVDMTEFFGGRIRLVGLWIRSESRIAGTRLVQLPKLLGGLRVVIGAIVREERLIIPSGEDVIQAGDQVYFICEEQVQDRVLRLFGARVESKKNIMIIGGGKIGLRLAQKLEHKNYHLKLIDLNPDKCEELAEKLQRTIVLQGDGTDQDLLLEENVQNMDAVISVTGDEETNILTSLLAKQLQAKMTVTRINKFAYLPLVRAIGLMHTVSPRISAVNAILQHVRKGVITAVSIKDEAEALEVIVHAKSSLVGHPVKNLDFPAGAIILCIIRGDRVIIPTGESYIDPQDRLIILSDRKTISRVEKKLTVNLERI